MIFGLTGITSTRSHDADARHLSGWSVAQGVTLRPECFGWHGPVPIWTEAWTMHV